MNATLHRLVLIVLIAGWPSGALAHMPAPGMEGFYVGLLYPLSTPAQALLLLALGLMPGGFETDRIRAFLGGFLLGMVTGVLASSSHDAFFYWILGAAIAASGLAALTPGRQECAALALTTVGGFFLGAMSRDAGPVQDQLTVILGTFLSANVALLLVSVNVDWLQEKVALNWVPIAVRVAAAWVAAISLLLLALIAQPILVANQSDASRSNPVLELER